MNRRRERALGIVYALFFGGLYSLALLVAIHQRGRDFLRPKLICCLRIASAYSSAGGIRKDNTACE